LAEVDKDDIILATGSVFVAAAIRAIWRDLEN
jgi:hypothetical protein